MSHFDLHRFQSHSWLAFENFLSIHQRLWTISSPTSTWSSIHLLFFPAIKIERKNAGNGSFDSKGSWSWCEGDVEVLSKVDLSPFFLSWFKRSKRRIQLPPPLHREHREMIDSQDDEWIFRFRSGRGGGMNNLGVTLVWRTRQLWTDGRDHVMRHVFRQTALNVHEDPGVFVGYFINQDGRWIA